MKKTMEIFPSIIEKFERKCKKIRMENKNRYKIKNQEYKK